MHPRAARLLTRCALVLLAAWTAAGQAQVFPAAQWQQAPDPQAAGWSRERLDAAEAYTRANLKTDAWMLVHRGVVIRQYGDVARVSNVASVRKSVLGILAGIQVDRGRLALDRTLADLGIDDRDLLTPLEKSATVRQLLQARSGVYHPAAYETAEMKQERPARGAFRPGEHFYYNNWDFNALGTIYRQATGRSVYEDLRDELAAPLQMQDHRFDTAGRDRLEPLSVHPAYVMRLSTRDMARLGLLMARGGQWRGRSLVSGHWVEESTTAHSPLKSGSAYGYLWWVGLSRPVAARLQFPGKVFLAIGNQGQFILVDPVRDLVFVHKVDFEMDPLREVTTPQFVELLARVLAAML